MASYCNPQLLETCQGLGRGLVRLQWPSVAGNTPHVCQNGREMDRHFCDLADSQMPPFHTPMSLQQPWGLICSLASTSAGRFITLAKDLRFGPDPKLPTTSSRCSRQIIIFTLMAGSTVTWDREQDQEEAKDNLVEVREELSVAALQVDQSEEELV